MDNAAYLGILNTQTIAYAGFALLGVFLLVIISYALLTINPGTFLTVATTVISGAALLILAYFIIYSMGVTIIGSEENITINSDAPLSMPEQPIIIPSESSISDIQTINGVIIDVIPNTSTVRLYWEVINGVGCCEALGCIYEEFETQCINPFKLYNLYLDDIYLPTPTIEEYEYFWQDCEMLEPWNEYGIDDQVTLGMHKLEIVQTDCETIVDTRTIFFELVELDGTYYVVME